MMLALLLASIPATAPGAPPKPSIVSILADDLGSYDTVSPRAHFSLFTVRGLTPPPLAQRIHNPEAPTPRIGQLMAESLRLDRHYAFRYCSPTRRSFLCAASTPPPSPTPDAKRRRPSARGATRSTLPMFKPTPARTSSRWTLRFSPRSSPPPATTTTSSGKDTLAISECSNGRTDKTVTKPS